MSSNLLIADGECPEIRELLAEALIPVLWLKDGQHPLETVTAALEMRRQQGQPVETLHWVSHGRPGVLQVAAHEITRQTLVLHRADLETWGIKNLALWSCRYGAEPESVGLLEGFTGASVFASANVLGRTSEAITQWKLGDTNITIPVDSAHLSKWAHQLGEKMYTTHENGTKLGYIDKSDNSFIDLGKFNDGTDDLARVWGLAFSQDGNLYATQEYASYHHDPTGIGTKIYKIDLTSSTDPATTVLTQAAIEVTTDSSVAGDPGGPIQFHAVDIDSDGLMYALDLRGYIYSIDITTGAATYVAETSKSDNSKITSAMDIAFDIDGNLFAVDGAGTLYQISLDGTTTAGATLLGSTSTPMLMGLLVTSDNTLYGTNLSSGKLFSINKSTGTLTEETSTSFTNYPHGGDTYIAYSGWPSEPGAPLLTTPTAGSIVEIAGSSKTTTSGLTGTLSASDANGDALTYAITGGSTANGISTLAGSYGSLSLNASTGEYSYTPDSSAVEALDDGDSVSDSFTITASDGVLSDSATYTVNLTGADDPTSSSKSSSESSNESSSESSNESSSESSSESSNAKLPSIDDAVTQKKTTTFELIKSVKVNNKNISTIIIGTENKDEITGTLSGEIIASMSDRDNIRGGGGADGFLFQDRNHFGKKEQDTIVDFNPERGDSLLIDGDIFDLGNNHILKKVKNMKKAKRKDNSKADFIYEEKRGHLWYNENGKEDGWGDGGVFVKLKGAPELGLSDFTIA